MNKGNKIINELMQCSITLPLNCDLLPHKFYGKPIFQIQTSSPITKIHLDSKHSFPYLH